MARVARSRPGRQRSPGGKGAQPRKFKRRFETYQTKLAIINHFKASKDMSATLAKYYPDLEGKQRDPKRKSVYLWEKRRNHIEEQCTDTRTGATRKTRPLGTATILSAQAEDEIVLWVRALRDEGVPVSALMLKTRVLEVGNALQIPRSILSASYNFRRGFMRRHDLSFRHNTRKGQIAPPDALEMAANFKQKVLTTMRELGVERVFNADQTAVIFEYVPKVTLSAKGAKTVWVRCGGKDKDRISVMLLSDSHGTNYAPFIVAKVAPSKVPSTNDENIRLRQGFDIHIWREVKDLQKTGEVMVYGNTRGWWNEGLSVAFSEYHFGARTSMEKPILLLWDDLSAHWTPAVKACPDRIKVKLLKVPPDCTAVCQPADISWNAPLKARLRVRWVDNLRQQLTAPRKEGVKFKLEAPRRKDVAKWVIEAWQNLSAKVIKSGFSYLKLGPTETSPRICDPPQDARIIAQMQQISCTYGLGRQGDRSSIT